MKNFIFKSDADFHKMVFNKLDMILAVLREQRMQLDRTEYFVKKIVVDKNLQKTVDKYFEEEEDRSLPLEDNTKDIPEE